MWPGRDRALEQDYYEILGIGRETSDAEIKKAYKRLAVQYHPDRNQGSKQAEEKFKDLAEAYAVLSDPRKRELYDRFGKDDVSGFVRTILAQGQIPFDALERVLSVESC